MSTGSSTKAMHDIGGNSAIRVGGEKPGRSGRLVSRQATSQDIEAFYGRPSRSSLRATVVLLDDKVAGVVGVVRDRQVGRFFSDYKPELQPYLKQITIMRAVKGAVEYAIRYRGPVVAVARDAEGCRILNRLGFTHLQGALYGWLN